MEFIIYGSYFIFLILILITSGFSKKLALANLLVFLTYTTILVFGLYFKSEGGTGLVWGVYILFFTGLHFLGLVVYLVLKWLKIPKSRITQKKYLLLFGISLGLVFLGFLLHIVHFPMGKELIFIGLGAAGFGLVAFLIKKKN